MPVRCIENSKTSPLRIVNKFKKIIDGRTQNSPDASAKDSVSVDADGPRL